MAVRCWDCQFNLLFLFNSTIAFCHWVFWNYNPLPELCVCYFFFASLTFGLAFVASVYKKQRSTREKKTIIIEYRAHSFTHTHEYTQFGRHIYTQIHTNTTQHIKHFVCIFARIQNESEPKCVSCCLICWLFVCLLFSFSSISRFLSVTLYHFSFT